MRTVIIATLNSEQLQYLRNLANEHGIEAEFIVEVTENAPAPQTPITGEMLEAVAALMQKSVLEIAQIANQYGITTVEEALQHSDVPDSVKEILESYL